MPDAMKQSDLATIVQRAVIPGQQNPLGYQQLTATGSAQTLTVPQGAVFALIAAEGSLWRWRDDGTAPTTSIGYPLFAGAECQYNGNLAALKLIAASGAILDVSYYG